MRAACSRRPSITSPIEPLENRRLLSGTTVGADVLGLDDSAGARSFAASGLVVQSVALVKIEGTFSGHYVSSNYGKNTLTFVITHDTHTGHFVGTLTVATPGGTLTGSAKGVIRTDKHVSISISGPQITGTFTGNASHTGGSFYGSYSVKVGGKINDQGTYHVGKA